VKTHEHFDYMICSC